MIAGGACQPFSFDLGDDTVIVGSGGTAFAPEEDHGIKVREGRLVIAAGDKGTQVRTMFGTVRIPGGSAGILDQKTAGVVRIANLAGDDINVSLTANGKSTALTAASGEELVIATDGVNEEELIATDGVDRQVISGSLTVSDLGLKGSKQKFNRQMMAEKDPLLLCNMGCLTSAGKKRWDKVIQSMNGRATPVAQRPGEFGARSKHLNTSQIPKLPEVPGSATDQFTPISFLHPAQPEVAATSVQTLSTRNCTVKHPAGTIIGLEGDNSIDLREGKALISARKQTVVRCGANRLTLDAGSMALVSKSATIFKAVNLYEPRHACLQANLGRHTTKIVSGQEIIVGASDGSLPRELKRDQIGRRHIKQVEAAKGTSILRSEVSLVSLLSQDKLLSVILKSKAPADRQLSHKLIKMAVCVNQVTVSHGAYSAVQP